MPDKRDTSLIKGRAARWKKGAAKLIEPLNNEQRAALQLARAGFPPAFILSWTTVSDTGRALEPPLQAIEGIARTMLRTYEWPPAATGREWPPSGFLENLRDGGRRPVGPDWKPDPNGCGFRQDRRHDRVYPRYDKKGRPIEGRPDFRFELLRLIELSAELRAALAGQYLESAILRAMTIGTLFGRIASMVLDGPSTAIGAASSLCKGEGHENRRETLREKLGDRNAEIHQLDSQALGLRGKSERAAHIKPKLDKWVTRYNKDRVPEDCVDTLSTDRISRMLPVRN